MSQARAFDVLVDLPLRGHPFPAESVHVGTISAVDLTGALRELMLGSKVFGKVESIEYGQVTIELMVPVTLLAREDAKAAKGELDHG